MTYMLIFSRRNTIKNKYNKNQQYKRIKIINHAYNHIMDKIMGYMIVSNIIMDKILTKIDNNPLYTIRIKALLLIFQILVRLNKLKYNK